MDRFGWILAKISSLVKEEIYNQVELILEKHFFQSTGNPEFPLLHFSAAWGDEKLTQYLLDINYYDVNTQDFNGTTPLMVAVKNRHEIIIQILLRAGADITMLNYKKESALHMFCAEHSFTFTIHQIFFNELRKQFATSEETAQCLIDAGCHLYQAAYLGDAEIIEYMLKKGISVSSMHPVSKTTALHVAVSMKSVDSVKLLLKYAGNVSNTVSLFEHVPSSIKENRNQNAELAVVNYLFQCDATEFSKLYEIWRMYGEEKLIPILLKRYYYYVNAQDNAGNTPLMMALRTGELIIIKTLLAAGANITMLNYDNKSVLDIALAGHHLKTENRKLILLELHKKCYTSEEVAQRLINAGSDLYQAAYLNDAKIIQYMLERGFSADSAHPLAGESALHLAVAGENIDSVKSLLKYGSNVNAQNIQGATPLFYMCQLYTNRNWEEVEVLKMFLNSGSLLTSCNSLGTFQISPVLMRGNCEMIRLILHSNIDFAAKDQNSEMSVLHYLATNINPGVVDEIKLHLDKFDVNVINASGLSPLHAAVNVDNVHMVELLLSKGVSPNCAHKRYGYTPLYYAYARFDQLFEYQWTEQRDKCVDLLLHHNANPQFIATDETNNEQLTIFDAGEKTNNLDKLKPVIAHLAILEELGVSITETTSTKMNLYPLLKKYFHECQKLVKKRICGSVTIFKLLTDDERKIARYSGNKKLMLKLERLRYKKNLKSYHSLYYNSLIKRFTKAIQRSRLVGGVAEVICKIFGDRLNSTSLIIGKIIDYLNDENLQPLYELYRILCKNFKS